MPEYHNIQAYLSLAARPHEEALAMFATVLSDIATPSGATSTWLAEAGRDLLSAGGYAPTGPDLVARFGNVELVVRPLISHWTPATIPHLSAPWLEVTLLLQSEQIELWTGSDARFRPDLEATLLQLVTSFLPISIDSPTFLTNEATDGQPWDAFTGGREDPWSFDLAVADPRLRWPRGAIPAGFERVEHGSGVVVLRRNSWSSLPTSA